MANITCSFRLAPHHRVILSTAAKQLGCTETQVLREMLEVFSGCKATWSGPFVRFERPKFRQAEEGRYIQ